MNAQTPTTDSLSRLLADSYLLYLKTHNFHWNVTGPMFTTLHTLFETEYTELALAVDEIAERIRALGAVAPGTFSAYGKLASIKEAEGVPKATDMIKELVADQAKVVAAAKAVVKAAEAAGDDATADLGIRRIQIHEKNSWMLASHLGVECCRRDDWCTIGNRPDGREDRLKNEHGGLVSPSGPRDARGARDRCGPWAGRRDPDPAAGGRGSLTGSARLRHLLASRGTALLATVVLTSVAAVLATWPLGRHLATATLGSGEVLLTAWQLNWFQHALLTDPLAWVDANIFFPYENAATLNDLLLTHAVVTLPAAWAESPVLALNLALLGGIVLCGVFAHLLILELTDDPWAATVGGTLFALTPFRFLHIGHLSIAAAWAIPLFFWALLRHLRQPSWGRAALASASGVAVALSSLYHAAYVAPIIPLVAALRAPPGSGGTCGLVAPPRRRGARAGPARLLSRPVRVRSGVLRGGVGAQRPGPLRGGSDVSGPEAGLLRRGGR